MRSSTTPSAGRSRRTRSAISLLLGQAKIDQYRLHVSVVLFQVLPELLAGYKIVGPEIPLQVLAPFRHFRRPGKRVFPVGDLCGAEPSWTHDGAPAAGDDVHSLFLPRGNGGQLTAEAPGRRDADDAHAAGGDMGRGVSGGGGNKIDVPA